MSDFGTDTDWYESRIHFWLYPGQKRQFKNKSSPFFFAMQP